MLLNSNRFSRPNIGLNQDKEKINLVLIPTRPGHLKVTDKAYKCNKGIDKTIKRHKVKDKDIMSYFDKEMLTI